MKVYLSIGTNIGDKKQNLEKAINLLNELCGKVIKQSKVYETVAWGFKSKKIFYNNVIELNTELTPIILLSKIQQIENKLGRIKSTNGYTDRVIDIDILFYENEIIDTENLKIPHPLLQERNFVLYPMVEINAKFIHPILKRTVKYLKQTCIDSSKIVVCE